MTLVNILFGMNSFILGIVSYLLLAEIGADMRVAEVILFICMLGGLLVSLLPPIGRILGWLEGTREVD